MLAEKLLTNEQDAFLDRRDQAYGEVETGRQVADRHADADQRALADLQAKLGLPPKTPDYSSVSSNRASVARLEFTASRFSPGAAVAKQRPVGALGVNVRGAEAFILAVIPLDQVGIDLGRATETGQLASPRRAYGASPGGRDDEILTGRVSWRENGIPLYAD